VGKGITFDSGGLSIKPAVHMETMKEDMSGAAAVIATMDAIGALKPDVNVIGITPLSENLPSGKATKPGEIVRFYNGKTAEIKNTDAEGRLILADALSYAIEQYKPDMIIDIATLTGACAHALGPFYCGLMSDDDALVNTIQTASDRTGDRVWRLPLHNDYKPSIRSVVADICNIGSPKYSAGAITAALFLQNFVGDTPWAHLDIAGTAFDVPDIPYYRAHSATGFGVRLMIDIAMNWK
jgi:leucyl aminopeptidase